MKNKLIPSLILILLNLGTILGQDTNRDDSVEVCISKVEEVGYIVFSSQKAKKIALDLNDLDYYKKRNEINEDLLKKKSQKVDLLERQNKRLHRENKLVKIVAIPAIVLLSILNFK